MSFITDTHAFIYHLTQDPRLGEKAVEIFDKSERIVKVTRKVGKAKMYKLNKDNEVAKKLIELDTALGKKVMEESLKEVEVLA